MSSADFDFFMSLLNEAYDNDKTFYQPSNHSFNKAWDALIKQGYRVEIIKLKDLDNPINDLYNDADLQGYHGFNNNSPAKDYRLDDTKILDWAGRDVMSCVREKNGELVLSDGRHRCRALLNQGYKYIEILVYDKRKKGE